MFGFIIPSNRINSTNIHEKVFITRLNPRMIKKEEKSIISNEDALISLSDFLDFLFQLPLNTTLLTQNSFLLPDGNIIHFKSDDEIISNIMMNIVIKTDSNQMGKSPYYDIIERNNKSRVLILKRRVTPPFNYIQQSLLPKNHPFRKLGKIILCNMDNWDISPAEYEFLKDNCVSPQTRTKIEGTHRITDNFFKGLPGYSKIQTIDDEKFPMKIFFKDGAKNVHSIIYIDAAYKEAIKKANFFELDASFKLFRPYCFCIVVVVIDNESFPIGFIIGPSEKKELYSEFTSFLGVIDRTSLSDLFTKPLLSDEGSALKSFAKDNNLKHFYCFRHLIEKFGSKSTIGKLVATLLFQQNEVDFLKCWNDNFEIIDDYFSKQSENKHNKVNQFKELFNYSEIDHQPHFDEQSIWSRALMRVSTTSNHIESIHHQLNSRIKNSRAYIKRLIILISYIHERQENCAKRPNLMRAIKSVSRSRESECLDTTYYLKALYNLDETKKFPNLFTLGVDVIIPDIIINRMIISQTNFMHIQLKNTNWDFTSIDKIEKETELTPEEKRYVEKNGFPLHINKLYPFIIKGLTYEQKERLFIRFNYHVYPNGYNYDDRTFIKYASFVALGDFHSAKTLLVSKVQNNISNNFGDNCFIINPGCAKKIPSRYSWPLNFSLIKESPIDKDGKTLTDNQLEVMNYLRFCYSNHINSILTKDGKNNQYIEIATMLNSLLHTTDINGPFLIISPKLDQWYYVLSQWTDLIIYILSSSVHKHEFNKCFKMKDNKGRELDCLTFQILVTDWENLITNYYYDLIACIEWAHLVIDDSYANNFKSKTLLDLKFVSFTMVTETSINNKEELSSLFQFISPVHIQDDSHIKFDPKEFFEKVVRYQSNKPIKQILPMQINFQYTLISPGDKEKNGFEARRIYRSLEDPSKSVEYKLSIIKIGNDIIYKITYLDNEFTGSSADQAYRKLEMKMKGHTKRLPGEWFFGLELKEVKELRNE